MTARDQGVAVADAPVSPGLPCVCRSRGPGIDRHQHEHAFALRVQRSLAGLRIVAGLAAFALVLTERNSHPALEWSIEIVTWAVYAAAGGVLLRIARSWSRPGVTVLPGRLRSLHRASVALDTVILLVQPALHMYGGSNLDLSPVLVYPLLVAAVYAVRGALAGTAALALALLAADQFSRVVNGYGLDPDDSIVVLLLALAAGVVGAAMVAAAAEARALADAEAARAQAAAGRAERARATMQGVHRVLSSGIAAGVHAACSNMAATIQDLLEAEAVTIRLKVGRDQASPTVDIMSGTLPSDGAKPIVTPVVSITGELMGQLQIHGAPAEHTDIEEVTLLADQVGLAAHAAQMLDQEASIAGQYRDLDRLRADFLALAAHELRTPTTAIHGALSTLAGRGDQLPEDVSRQLLDAAGRHTGRLIRLADDLLTIGRSDAGDIPLRLERVDVLTLASEVVEAVGRTGGQLSLAAGPPAQVNVDVARAKQILSNLIENASAHGVPPVELAWEVVGDSVALSVTDAGEIDDIERARIFERFFVGGIEHHSKGSGLGLPISRDLAQAMGGSLELDETSGTTRFVLTLPLVADDEAASVHSGNGQR